MRILILIFVSLFVATSCDSEPTNELRNSASPQDKPDYVVSKDCHKNQLKTKLGKVEPNAIRVMAYNVYNLFNTTPDKENGNWKKDYEYQPPVKINPNTLAYVGHHRDAKPAAAKRKYDFCVAEKKKCESSPRCKEDPKQKLIRCAMRGQTKADLKNKFASIKKAFNAQFKRGAKPDVLVLTEVENAEVVKELGKKIGMLDPKKCKRSCANQGFWMTTSPDYRGIDIAVIYNSKKLKFIQREAKEHHANTGPYPTRNILEVHFEVQNREKSRLIVFGNHWPSQGAKTKIRAKAAATLKGLIKASMGRFPSAHVLATGDFNTIKHERGLADGEKHPFNDVILKGSPSIYDLDVNPDSSTYKNPLTKKGSYYYHPQLSWNHLDKFFINKALQTRRGGPLTIDPKRHLIHNFAALTGDRETTIYRTEADAKNDGAKYINLISKVKDEGALKYFKTKPNQKKFKNR